MSIEKINDSETVENLEPTKNEVLKPFLSDGKIDDLFLDEQIKKDEMDIKNIRERLGLKESLESWELLEDPKFDENNFYRVINEAGYQDFIETGKVRSSPTGTKPNIVGTINIGNRPTPFPAFDKGAPNLTYLDKESENNYILETSSPLYKRGDPHPLTGNPINSNHWGYRPIDETGSTSRSLSKEDIKDVYKVDKEGQIFIKKS